MEKTPFLLRNNSAVSPPGDWSGICVQSIAPTKDEFIDRYRLNEECVLTILAAIRDCLEPKQKKLSSISPLNQFLIALRFYARLINLSTTFILSMSSI
jgi:hypothetical protein